MSRPLPLNVITKALQSMLAKDTRTAGVPVLRSPLLNDDPSKCPWVGIYRNTTQFEVRALVGTGFGSYRQKPEIVLVVQHSGSGESDAIEDDFEKLLADIMDVIFSDPTLQGVVQALTLTHVQYRLIENTDDEMLHQAEIHVVPETII